MTAPLPPGATFANGVDGLHTNGARWAETLTVVKLDTQTYGNTRYIVSDASGRRAYAIARRSY